MKVKVELLNSFVHPQRMMKSITTKHLKPEDAEELYKQMVELIEKYQEDK
ncbi:MAG: hypothetical protein HWN81_00040 [Candidatus Lokiarchaeota archaeon]|nr:hypothetical protein [Candidatus Lokiarchaeota archaeon]